MSHLSVASVACSITYLSCDLLSYTCVSREILLCTSVFGHISGLASTPQRLVREFYIREKYTVGSNRRAIFPNTYNIPRSQLHPSTVIPVVFKNRSPASLFTSPEVRLSSTSPASKHLAAKLVRYHNISLCHLKSTFTGVLFVVGDIAAHRTGSS